MKRARIETSSSTNHVDRPDSPSRASKLPKISRKVNACTECQARKVKCDAEPTERLVCSRCAKKGLLCVVNKSLQSLLEEGTEWRTSMEDSMQRLQSAVSKILSVLDLPSLGSFVSHDDSNQSSNGVEGSLAAVGESARTRAAVMAMTRENSGEPETSKMNDALVSAPMGSLFEVTRLRNLRSRPYGAPRPKNLADDFISRGKVSESEAEELFEIFRRTLNHYLWGGIALVHKTLRAVRQSSSLLMVAILTATALHIPGKEQIFDICYVEFVGLVSESMFDRHHTLDGVRGLCIGAFWLSEVSWKLSGHAVRIATELNLHQSYARAMRGVQEQTEGARLWYFLYVCDHHFSIAYGRPPVIHDDASIVKHERFLGLPGITEADIRLHSQVSLFIILTEVYNAFGPDIEQALSEDDLLRLQHFSLALDSYRTKWEPRLAPNDYIANYPAKGVGLHYNFAKLQVSSLALRGIEPSSVSALTTNRRALANVAICCALSTLQIVLDEPDIRNSIVGVPIYLHTMITYSAVFLLKIQHKWKAFRLETDTVFIGVLVKRIIAMLKEGNAGERHLSCHIATGLSKMLDRFTPWEAQERLPSETVSADTRNPPVVQCLQPIYDMGPVEGLFGHDKTTGFYDEHYFPMGFFDILSSTQFDPGLWDQS